MKRLRRIAAVAGLAAVGLVAALYLFRGSLVHPLLLRRVSDVAAERLGASLEVRELESDWFTGVRLGGVRWSSDRPPLLSLEASEVELEWSLVGLVRGETDWIQAIRATVESAELAGGGPAEPRERELSGGRSMPASLPPLDLSVAHFTYALGGGMEVEARGVRARIEHASQGESRREVVSVLADSAVWRDPARELAGPLDVTGAYEAGRVEIARASLGELVRISAGGVDLTHVGEGRLTWSATADVLGGVLRTEGALGDAELRIDVAAERVDPAALAVYFPDLPEGLDALADLDASVVLTLGDDRRAELEIRSLVASKGVDVIRVVQLSAPISSEGWRATALAARGRVELDHRGEWHVLGPWDTPELPPHHVAIAAELDAGRATVSGEVRTEGGLLRIQRGEVSLSSDPEAGLGDAQLDLLLDADFDEIRTVAKILGFEASGGLHGAIDLDGPLTSPVGQLKAVAVDLRTAGIEIDSAELDIVSDGQRVEIARCEFLSEPWRGSLTGVWLPDDGELESLSLALAGGAGRELVPGLNVDSLEVAVEAAGALDRLAGTFTATGAGVPLGALGTATFESAGGFEGREVRLDRLVLEAGPRTLRASGAGGVTEGGFELELDALQLEGSAGSIELERAARIAWSDGTLIVDELFLRSQVDGRLGRLEAQTEGTRVEVLLDDFDPRPLLEVALPEGMSVAGLHGTVQGDLSPTAPDVTVDLEVRGLVPRAGGPSYELFLRGRLTPDLVLSAEFEGKSDELARLSCAIEVPYDPAQPSEWMRPGPVHLALEAEDLRVEVMDQLLGAGTLASGKAYLSVDLSGSWEELAGDLVFRAADLRSPEIDAALGEAIEVELEAELGRRTTIRNSEIRASGGRLIRAEGSLELPLDLDRLSIFDQLALDAPVDLRMDFDVPLAGWATRAEGIRRLDGRLSGQTRLYGTLREPLFGGDVQLRDGELRLSSAFPAIRSMNADIVFDGRAVRIVSLEGEVGAAPCEVTGEIDFATEDVLLDLTLSGRNLLLARSTTAKVRADTDLSVRGPLRALVTSGEVVITEGRHAQDIDLLASLQPSGTPANPEGWRPTFWTAPPLSNMQFDVRVRTSTEFTLRGNLYEVAVRPDLHLRGTGRVPLFEGRVYVDPSSLSLPSGRLQISTGVVDFKQDRPFEPELSINGELRSRGFDITAQISGPITRPEVVLSSIPTLANDELLVLFLTGQLPQGTGDDRLEAAQSVGVYLAQDYLTRWIFGETGAEESVLDRVAFEVGADVSRTGAPTMKGVLYLEPHRDRTGKTTYLVVERDKFDFVNYAFGIRFRFR